MYPCRRLSLWTLAVTVLAWHSSCHTSQPVLFRATIPQPALFRAIDVWRNASNLHSDGKVLHFTNYTHTHPFNGPFPGLPRWAGTRKVKPIRILLKQETVSGSGISRAICKSAPRSRQITTPAPHHSVFYRPDALPAAQPIASKHWRHHISQVSVVTFSGGVGKWTTVCFLVR